MRIVVVHLSTILQKDMYKFGIRDLLFLVSIKCIVGSCNTIIEYYLFSNWQQKVEAVNSDL